MLRPPGPRLPRRLDAYGVALLHQLGVDRVRVAKQIIEGNGFPCVAVLAR